MRTQEQIRKKLLAIAFPAQEAYYRDFIVSILEIAGLEADVRTDTRFRAECPERDNSFFAYGFNWERTGNPDLCTAIHSKLTNLPGSAILFTHKHAVLSADAIQVLVSLIKPEVAHPCPVIQTFTTKTP